MRTRVAVAFLLASLLAYAASAEEDAARQVLQRLLELNAAGEIQSEEAQALLTGEAASRWTTGSIGSVTGPVDALVGTRAGGLAARVTATAPNGEAKDFYFFLTKAPSWKVSAMRTLSATGPLYVIRDLDRDHASQMPGGTYTLENVRLTLLSDQELKAWFAEHKASLEELASLVAGASAERYRVDAAHADGEDPIAGKLRGLGLSSARRRPGAVGIVVGGLVDNTVGFLHLSAGEPPPISPDDYIWVEPLGEGWFLFRTT